MKQKGEAFAKVVWIQIANLIRMVQFRCGTKFTVSPTDGKNSDQWRREDPGNREPSQLILFHFLDIKLVLFPNFMHPYSVSKLMKDVRTS